MSSEELAKLLSPAQAEHASDMIDELTMMSMLFDMDIDLEALCLVVKSEYNEPFWLTKWKDKESGKDFDERFDIDQE